MRDLRSLRASPGMVLLVILGGLLLIGWVVAMIWQWLVGAAVLVVVGMVVKGTGR